MEQLEKYVPAGGVTIKALDHAFTTILDLDDHTQNWFRFEQKRDRLQRERVEAQVRTPHENLTAENEARKSEDNSNRAKDLKTLRHEAPFRDERRLLRPRELSFASIPVFGLGSNTTGTPDGERKPFHQRIDGSSNLGSLNLYPHK